MSQRGTEFIECWIQEHFHGKDPHDRGDRRPVQWARDCVAAAAEVGITREEIEEDFGDLEEFMEMAITEQNQLRVDADATRHKPAESATPEGRAVAGTKASESDHDDGRNTYGNLLDQ